MKNADTVAASAGEEIGLKYAVARREMPDCPCADKSVQDFSVIERDPEVWLVVETIGAQFVISTDGKVGPVSQKLYDTLRGIQYGEVADEHGWCEIID